jgi:hypothetical protein
MLMKLTSAERPAVKEFETVLQHLVDETEVLNTQGIMHFVKQIKPLKSFELLELSLKSF